MDWKKTQHKSRSFEETSWVLKNVFCHRKCREIFPGFMGELLEHCRKLVLMTVRSSWTETCSHPLFINLFNFGFTAEYKIYICQTTYWHVKICLLKCFTTEWVYSQTNQLPSCLFFSLKMHVSECFSQLLCL